MCRLVGEIVGGRLGYGVGGKEVGLGVGIGLMGDSVGDIVGETDSQRLLSTCITVDSHAFVGSVSDTMSHTIFSSGGCAFPGCGSSYIK